MRRPSGTATRSVWIATAAIGMLLAATAWRYRPPPPLGGDAPATAFSAARALEFLRPLVGDGRPHPLGSPAGTRMRERVVQALEALGLHPELQSGTACHDGDSCGYVTNVVTRFEGTEPTAPAVLLSAHYDSVPAGPGASDDGSSVAAILEIARALRYSPAPRNPLILLIDDGEEAGMLGAQLFVSAHRWARGVGAAVNLDARGTSGPSFMFETGSANHWLMNLYARAIAQPMTNSVYYLAYKMTPNDTDFTVFRTLDYQGFNFAFLGDVRYYHTALDRLEHVDPATLQHQGANALAMVRLLAGTDLAVPSARQAVFFDWWRLGLIRWPTVATPLAAIGAALLLLGLCLRLARRGELALRALPLAVAAIAGAWLCSVLLAVLDLLLLHRLGAVTSGPYSWIAQPLPMLISANLLAFVGPALAARWLAARSGFWDLWFATQLLNAVFAVILALLLPELSFLFLVPLAIAVLAALPAALSARSAPWMRVSAALLPLLAAVSLVLPLTRFLYDALGSVGWCATTVVLGISLWALAPLLVRATRRTQQLWLLIPLAALLLGTLLTWHNPPYSAAWPQRVNLDYLLDADAHQAHWIALPDSGRLPAYLQHAAPFELNSRPPYPGSADLGFFAPAPPLSLAAPELTVLSASAEGGGTRYRVRLDSPRHAPEIYLVFAAAARVDAAELASERGALPIRLWRWPNGATVLDLKTVGERKVEVTFKSASRTPPALQLLDQSFGLPAEGAVLAAARPAEATVSQDGDVLLVSRSIRLPVPTLQ